MNSLTFYRSCFLLLFLKMNFQFHSIQFNSFNLEKLFLPMHRANQSWLCSGHHWVCVFVVVVVVSFISLLDFYESICACVWLFFSFWVNKNVLMNCWIFKIQLISYSDVCVCVCLLKAKQKQQQHTTHTQTHTVTSFIVALCVCMDDPRWSRR